MTSQHPRRLIIVGAATGIGAVTVDLLAAEGWRLGLVDRHADGLAAHEQVATVTAVADVTDVRGYTAALSTAPQGWGESTRCGATPASSSAARSRTRPSTNSTSATR